MFGARGIYFHLTKDLPMSHRHSLFGFTFLFGSFCLIGCSASSSVEGTVQFDGKPVDGGKIVFSKQAEKGRSNVVHGTIENGSYSLKSGDLSPGNYVVEIYWEKKTGKKVPSNDLPDSVDEMIQVIPPQFNTKSKQTVEIKAGANTHNFDTKSIKESEKPKPGKGRDPDI